MMLRGQCLTLAPFFFLLSQVSQRSRYNQEMINFV
jgi:hypothetical protein